MSSSTQPVPGNGEPRANTSSLTVRRFLTIDSRSLNPSSPKGGPSLKRRRHAMITSVVVLLVALVIGVPVAFSIGLSALALHPRHVVPKPGQAYETEVPVEVREWISPALASPDLVPVAQPPTQPRSGVVVERTVRAVDGAYLEVVRPAAQRAVRLAHQLRGSLATSSRLLSSDKARSGSGGAAGTARCPCSRARTPCTPPVPRSSGLGLKGGRHAVHAALATGPKLDRGANPNTLHLRKWRPHDV